MRAIEQAELSTISRCQISHSTYNYLLIKLIKTILPTHSWEMQYALPIIKSSMQSKD